MYLGTQPFFVTVVLVSLLESQFRAAGTALLVQLWLVASWLSIFLVYHGLVRSL